jgi:hypothetical protein
MHRETVRHSAFEARPIRSSTSAAHVERMPKLTPIARLNEPGDSVIRIWGDEALPVTGGAVLPADGDVAKSASGYRQGFEGRNVHGVDIDRTSDPAADRGVVNGKCVLYRLGDFVDCRASVSSRARSVWLSQAVVDAMGCGVGGDFEFVGGHYSSASIEIHHNATAPTGRAKQAKTLSAPPQ